MSKGNGFGELPITETKRLLRRQQGCEKGHYRDMTIYSILRSEWAGEP